VDPVPTGNSDEEGPTRGVTMVDRRLEMVAKLSQCYAEYVVRGLSGLAIFLRGDFLTRLELC
jgi:hypothetical protein